MYCQCYSLPLLILVIGSLVLDDFERNNLFDEARIKG
jgi:hypothetical protein